MRKGSRPVVLPSASENVADRINLALPGPAARSRIRFRFARVRAKETRARPAAASVALFVPTVRVPRRRTSLAVQASLQENVAASERSSGWAGTLNRPTGARRGGGGG